LVKSHCTTGPQRRITPNRIFLVDPVIEALRQKRRLSPVCSLNEPLHDHPRRIIEGIITTLVFSHTQGRELT
jgi:hypothetical protein